MSFVVPLNMAILILKEITVNQLGCSQVFSCVGEIKYLKLVVASF